MTTTSEVPGRLPVAINGHAYLADPVARETVPVMRQQADTSTEAGEQSLNRQGLWLRSQESWHHGAGQDFLDGRLGDTPPDPHRFRSSKGIDPWTRGQLSLHRPTLKVWATASTNLFLAVAQESAGVFHLYVSDGNELYWNAIPFSAVNSLAVQQGTGWTASNATISAEGVFFKLTGTAAAAVTATSPTGTNGFPVDPGRRYGFAFNSHHASVGGPKTPRINVTWYDAAGAAISSTTPAVAAGDDATEAIVIADATAPATAAFASITLSYTTDWVIGEIHWVQLASFAPYDDVSALGAADLWRPSNIQAGQVAQPVQSVATNGNYIWVALGTSGLHRTFAQSSSSTADVPAAPGSGQISLVGYAAPFLLAAGSETSTTGRNTLWVVEDPLGTPALSDPIMTHPNPHFAWEGIASGSGVVYAWGNSGGNGEVYKILFDPETGSLGTAASLATYLPDGETVHALSFYTGRLTLGTGKGVRIGDVDGAGNIDYGGLIPTDWPVRCFEPQDRYAWFGWTKYDATNSGLGRIDLGFETDRLTPAWASDLMTADASQGDTVAAVTFAPYGYTANQRPPVRVFTVAGEGVYIEDPGSRVPSGEIVTGTVRFSTSEPKCTRSVDVRHHALPAGAEVIVQLELDSSGANELLGTSDVADSYGPAVPIDAQNFVAEAIEYSFELVRPDPDGTDFSRSPELTRWTAKVLPLPSTIDEIFTIPIIMRSETLTNTGDGVPKGVNVPDEVAYLKGLEQTRTLIDIQIGAETITSCYVFGSKFDPDSWCDARKHQEGIYNLTVATARG